MSELRLRLPYRTGYITILTLIFTFYFSIIQPIETMLKISFKWDGGICAKNTSDMNWNEEGSLSLFRSGGPDPLRLNALAGPAALSFFALAGAVITK